VHDTRRSTGTRSADRTDDRPLVLVVDGELVRRFTTSLLLQRLGYHAFPVNTAEEALMITELATPRLIISEITLPQMNGIDLLRTLRQGGPAASVPVLIYTALRDPSYQHACELAGCTGFLVQPADPNQLYEAIQRATEIVPRHVVRLSTSLDVIVQGAAQRDGADMREQVTALSEQGMFVHTKEPLEEGARTTFTLFLDRALAWGIRVEGKVIYLHRDDETGKVPGMGVLFTQIRPEDREHIRSFIGKMLLKGIAVPVHKSGSRQQ